jgi:hypothetical protein
MYPLTRSTNRNRSWGNNSADFTAGFVNGVFDQRITHTRASTATYIDSTGAVATAAVNVPRITYNPATLECRGYLHEAAATNLALWSEDFSNSAWAAASSNVTAAANSIAFQSSNSYTYQFVNTGATILGTTWTLSGWLWSSTKATISLRIANTGNGADSAFLTVALTPTPTRVSVTRTFTGAGNNIDIGLDNRPSEGGDNVAGTVYCSRFQLEANTAATSYIPTAGSAVPRAADIAYIDVATHLAGLSPTNFTVFCEVQALTTNDFPRVIGTQNANESIIDVANATEIGTWDESIYQTVNGPSVVSAPRKMAVSGRVGARTVALAGSRADAISNALDPLTSLRIGGAGLGAASLFTGLYRVLRFWKRGFSAAETEALTE